MERLLDAWRSTRHAALADAIDALARANPTDPDDAAALLAALREGEKVSAIGARVEALGALAPDPRVASAYVAMLRAPPFTSSGNKPIWTKVLAQLVAMHDALVTHASPAFKARVEAYYLTLLRGDDGRWSEVEVTVHGVADALKNLHSGIKAVTRLSPERVRRLTVTVAPGEDATRLAALCDAIRARFPDARLTLPA